MKTLRCLVVLLWNVILQQIFVSQVEALKAASKNWMTNFCSNSKLKVPKITNGKFLNKILVKTSSTKLWWLHVCLKNLIETAEPQKHQHMSSCQARFLRLSPYFYMQTFRLGMEAINFWLDSINLNKFENLTKDSASFNFIANLVFLKNGGIVSVLFEHYSWFASTIWATANQIW